MDLLQYVIDEALILIPVLLVLGKIAKEMPHIPDWLIPFIMLFLGVVFANALMGVGVHAFIQGVLVAGASVFTHQLIKQPLDK